MANYLLLSLQTDEIVPTPKNLMNETLVEEIEKKLLNSMEKFGLTRLELFRKVAVKCENFIVFFRESSFGSDTTKWPKICGDLFYPIPLFSPFGTCFTTVSNLRLVPCMRLIFCNKEILFQNLFNWDQPAWCIHVHHQANICEEC